MPAQTYPPGTVLMRPMLDGLARNWWLILLRGVCAAVIFGLLTLIWPGLSLFTLIILYGALDVARCRAQTAPEPSTRETVKAAAA